MHAPARRRYSRFSKQQSTRVGKIRKYRRAAAARDTKNDSLARQFRREAEDRRSPSCVSFVRSSTSPDTDTSISSSIKVRAQRLQHFYLDGLPRDASYVASDRRTCFSMILQANLSKIIFFVSSD